MFWKKNEKLETLKDMIGSRAAYIETVQMLELNKREKDIFLRASLEVRKKKPNQEIIDKAYAILIGKSLQGEEAEDKLSISPDISSDKATNTVKEAIGTSSLFMEFINKYNFSSEERAILSGAYDSLKKEPYDMNRVYSAYEIIVHYKNSDKVISGETYDFKNEDTIPLTSATGITPDIYEKMETEEEVSKTQLLKDYIRKKAPIVKKSMKDASEKVLDESLKASDKIKKKIEENAPGIEESIKDTSTKIANESKNIEWKRFIKPIMIAVAVIVVYQLIFSSDKSDESEENIDKKISHMIKTMGNSKEEKKDLHNLLLARVAGSTEKANEIREKSREHTNSMKAVIEAERLKTTKILDEIKKDEDKRKLAMETERRAFELKQKKEEEARKKAHPNAYLSSSERKLNDKKKQEEFMIFELNKIEKLYSQDYNILKIAQKKCDNIDNGLLDSKINACQPILELSKKVLKNTRKEHEYFSKRLEKFKYTLWDRATIDNNSPSRIIYPKYNKKIKEDKLRIIRIKKYLKGTKTKNRDKQKIVKREQKKQKDIIRKFASYDNDVNFLKTVNAEAGYTPLHIACSASKDIEFAKFLLKKGADINAITEKGHTPLFKAVFGAGNFELTKLLLNNGAKVNVDNEVMYWAAGEDHRILKLLIEHGGDVNYKYSDKTPLIRACEEGNYENVKLLISNGAKINLGFVNSYPLRSTLEKGLYENDDKKFNNYKKIIKLLLDNGADVNQVYVEEAARYIKSPNSIYVRKKARHKTNLKFKIYKSPLMIASKRDRYNEAVSRMIALGAEINYAQEFKPVVLPAYGVGKAYIKSTALLEAIRGAAVKNVKLLLKKGANINQSVNSSIAGGYATVLNHTIREIDKSTSKKDMKKFDTIIELLISHGTDINECKKNSDTALALAVTKGAPSLVKLLIKKGANVNQISKRKNRTPVQLSVINHRPLILQLLIKSGADMSIKDDKDRDLYQLAKYHHSKSTILKLLKNSM